MSPDAELTTDQLTEGAALALINAERLRRDAQILIEAGAHASACFLLDTAVEERAKAFVLLRTRTELPSTWNSWWRGLRNHSEKWAVFKDATMNPTPYWSAEERLEIFREGARGDAKWREVTLYVDFSTDKGRWHAPTDDAFADQAEHLRRLGDWMLVAIGKILTDDELDALDSYGSGWPEGTRDMIRHHRDGAIPAEIQRESSTFCCGALSR